MKKVAVMAVLSLLVILGVLYGMARMGLLPTHAWAQKSPAMAHVLASLHLAPQSRKAAVPVAARPAVPTTPPVSAPPAVPAARTQTAPLQTVTSRPDAGLPEQKNGAASGPGKLVAILDTMDPDDIARIFAKMPDPAVVADLSALDEKKAGKILASLPVDRAARLSQRMAQPLPVAPSAGPSLPRTTL